ncbi:DNA helicase [Tanacetum coccineum]
MSLQFPLLFVYGEDGYSKEMKMVCVPGASSNEDRRLTMKAYYSYMLHDRINSFRYLSKTGRLFQQYVVTAFCVVKQNRIGFIREHQNDIRNEYLSGIYDAITRGDINGSDCDGRLILPQSFTGNPQITEYIKDFQRLTTTDKADIVDRVFEMKIHEFMKYLRDVKPFEKIIAGSNSPSTKYVVADNPHKKKTTLTEWLDYNEHYTDGRRLTYLDFPSEFVWHKTNKYWQRRRQRNKSSNGKMSCVHPDAGDFLYHRMLLSHKKGCRSFREIRTINNVVYPTYRAAMGLLGDDKEWETTIEEASLTATPTEL